MSPWLVKVLGTLLHHHQWQSEPLMWNKSFDERYGDEEDMAANAMFNDPEEASFDIGLVSSLKPLEKDGHISLQ